MSKRDHDEEVPEPKLARVALTEDEKIDAAIEVAHSKYPLTDKQMGVLGGPPHTSIPDVPKVTVAGSIATIGSGGKGYSTEFSFAVGGVDPEGKTIETLLWSNDTYVEQAFSASVTIPLTKEAAALVTKTENAVLDAVIKEGGTAKKGLAKSLDRDKGNVEKQREAVRKAYGLHSSIKENSHYGSFKGKFYLLDRGDPEEGDEECMKTLPECTRTMFDQCKDGPKEQRRKYSRRCVIGPDGETRVPIHRITRQTSGRPITAFQGKVVISIKNQWDLSPSMNTTTFNSIVTYQMVALKPDTDGAPAMASLVDI